MTIYDDLHENTKRDLHSFFGEMLFDYAIEKLELNSELEINTLADYLELLCDGHMKINEFCKIPNLSSSLKNKIIRFIKTEKEYSPGTETLIDWNIPVSDEDWFGEHNEEDTIHLLCSLLILDDQDFYSRILHTYVNRQVLYRNS